MSSGIPSYDCNFRRVARPITPILILNWIFRVGGWPSLSARI
jgi:hypothetical protein